jgi:hypothetical protein
VLALATAPGAAATTYCVPGFHGACPDAGGNVGPIGLEAAMAANKSDGQPDVIRIAPGTLTDPDTIEDAGGSDPLEIIGAGPGVTLLTSSDNGNQFVMNLAAGGSRAITVRDLTVVVPASFPDDLGSAIQAEQDAFENVDIESRNPGSNGAPSLVGGGSFRDGRIYGAAGGSIDDAIGTNGAEGGTLTVERTRIESPSWGIVVDDPEVPTTVRRTRIIDPEAYGVRVTDGAFATVENSIVEVDDATAFSVVANDAGTVIFSARHTTLIDTGGADKPAIDARVSNPPGNGSVNAVLSDSIVRGFATPYERFSASLGSATLSVRYSNLPPGGTSSGPGTLNLTANTNADPLFTGPADYHLLPASPSIDVGDPLTVSLPTQDFDGLARPVDGDGDGGARRDQGAFEYHPPGANPPAAPATAVPQTPTAAKKCAKKKRKQAGARSAKAKRKKCKRKRRR